MAIKPEHLDELLSGYEKPEDLLARGGIPLDRLKVSGRGARDPAVSVGPSSTAQERADAFAQNRRVEVEIVSRPKW
jgi:outer membrane protein OmpA-like peptidoglycan-associated protein